MAKPSEIAVIDAIELVFVELGVTVFQKFNKILLLPIVTYLISSKSWSPGEDVKFETSNLSFNWSWTLLLTPTKKFNSELEAFVSMSLPDCFLWFNVAIIHYFLYI